MLVGLSAILHFGHGYHYGQGRRLHTAIIVLGGLTILSAVVFLPLHAEDGDTISQHKEKAAETLEPPAP